MTNGRPGRPRPDKPRRDKPRPERRRGEKPRPSRAGRTTPPGTLPQPRPTTRTGPATQVVSLDRPEPAQYQHTDILALYRPDMARLLEEAGAPRFRRLQILEHLLLRPERPLAEAPNLPLGLRSSLEDMGASTLTLVDSVSSADGATKLLLRTADDLAIETVIMRYRNRVTVCVSSQVGCAVGCVFCATGTMGLTRNLQPAEIVDQVRAARAALAAEGRRASNLVYMGMGEPLHNTACVLSSIHILTHQTGMNMARRAVSVSTVGVPSGIRRLAQAEPQVNLAISIHAADDSTRALLVPARFRHPISDILQAAWEHFDLTGRRLLIEYVLIPGVNDSLDQARRLATLLRGHVVGVNLLAWNPVGSRTMRQAGFRTPSAQELASFRAALLAAGVETVIRQSRGATINAACGQLAGRSKGKGLPVITPAGRGEKQDPLP